MELLHLANSLHEPKPQATQTLHSGFPDAPLLPTNSKWVKQQMGDNGRFFDGLSLSSSLDRKIHPQKLMLSNTHMGCISGQECRSVGRDIYRLGHDLHVLPPRKLRKLLTTFSDGVHIFSCVERMVVSNAADFEWPKEGFDSMQSFLSKKRPWQVCGLNWSCDSADAVSGLLGLSSIYPRLTNLSMQQNEDDFCMQDLGSGGSFNGGGRGAGGDSGGSDGFGPEQPGSDNKGIFVMTGGCNKQEDGDMPDKAEVDGLEIPSRDTGHTSIQKSMFLNEDVMMASNVKSLPDGCGGENCSEEPRGIMDAQFQFLEKVLEHLRKAWSAEFNRIPYHEQARMVEESSSYIPMWQHNACHAFGGALQSNDHGDLQADLQDIDSPLADENFLTEINQNFLEKLKGLTLGSVKQLFPHAEHMQNSNRIQAEQVLKHKEDNRGKGTREEQLSLGQRLEGVVDWFDRLAHGISARYAEDQERSEKIDQAEDERLRSLINEAVMSALKQHSDSGGSSPLPKQADMETLRRLQREAFSELLKIRDKLDQMVSARVTEGGRSQSGSGKTVLKGEVKVGTAVVMLEDSSSRHSRGSLEQAGMQTGVDVRLTFETPFREKDLLITECVAGQGSTVGEGRSLGGPMSLGKVHYLAHINDEISISFVPVGAQGMDVTDIVNPMQDQGLTAFSSRGPAHFDHCKGSAIGATWSGSSFAASAAQYLSGWGNQAFSFGTDTRENGALCLSTLGQVLVQPTECLIFSLSGLNRFWPSPPLPSSTGLHWSEMGPLVIPKIQSLQTSRSTFSSEDSLLSHCNSLNSHWGMMDTEYQLDVPESKGTSLLSVAVASELELRKNLSLGAWAQVEMGDVLQDLDKGNFQWAVNVAKTSKNGVDWGASIGSARPDFWSASTSEQEMYPGFVGGVGDSYGPQLHMEAFLKLHCGKGFTLQPGLLYLLNKHSHTPALLVRSSWLF